MPHEKITPDQFNVGGQFADILPSQFTKDGQFISCNFPWTALRLRFEIDYTWCKITIHPTEGDDHGLNFIFGMLTEDPPAIDESVHPHNIPPAIADLIFRQMLQHRPTITTNMRTGPHGPADEIQIKG